MTATLPSRFGNKTLRPNKRQLSVEEKSTLAFPPGRALVLPGDPKTEIEELVSVGYDPCYIFGVEIDPKAYASLVNYYHDNAKIFHSDVFCWMKQVQAHGKYTYIHLDFCGHFNKEHAIGCQSWIQLPAPEARIRVSIFRGRRSPVQLDWESQMQEDLLLRWCELGHELDLVDSKRWITFYNHFQQTMDDSTKLVVSLMILNFFFGVKDYRDYLVECEREGSFLPDANGTHYLESIYRYTYNEPGSPNYMYTVWADLKEMSASSSLRNDSQRKLDQLAKTFENIDYDIPAFNF